ncbi:UDP-N-acetylmuramoylalanyl-D-glutamyl-2,6-diaminopimelate--D-alanyl-D-alanine ligase [Pseudovibrio sp. SPO723]|uniref:UDP-N-acetylmuramoylalanyl-D-glutamyl-2, 6-diaminopimelate--D-alanyl-D-alanine ligase n=1 Tax=Nesiotobacter zosterae TaxID=392721 RepID=UPI0029C2E17F|nr:UDP-N-acetylmuramoylalanyl-D-glutamyl-2,6-diaminopimelate--D-alanyl-D-alanine ligase [Pseudovibrio sp. SPO723]MDX5594031.1 UDP-N-acetylmuramoylalanyl-D-glutamyl-2,6-diaminopimelate--D-alanyl-D-alanine ligase [Pseudovibrio sp. SPO723]
MLLENLTYTAELPENAGALDVQGLTADSRGIGPGFLFAALSGAKTDGLSFAAQAAEKGAIAILVDADRVEEARKLVPAEVAVLGAPDARHELALMAAAFSGAQPDTMVAVTGTSGKTSVSEFVRQIFTFAGNKSASLGTLGVVTSDGQSYGGLTTPDPVKLHEGLAQLAKDGVTHAAMEASSHGLDQHRLDGVWLVSAGFTNLGRDHMDYHPTVEDYLQAKLRLFREVLPDGAAVVVDPEAPFGDRVVAVAEERGLPLFTVGANGEGLKLVSDKPEGFGQLLELQCDGETHSVMLPLAGEFQVSNALVAAGLAITAGVEPRVAIEALATLKGAPGRIEHVGTKANGGLVFVDYAHKPDALENVLAALRPFTKGRLISVFGCGGDRDKGKRPLMGEISGRLADISIVTDDNPRTEDPQQIRNEILDACPTALEIGDRAEAIRRGIELLGEGDILCVAGKGHETGQIVGADVLPFSDHDAIRDALAELDAVEGDVESVPDAFEELDLADLVSKSLEDDASEKDEPSSEVSGAEAETAADAASEEPASTPASEEADELFEAEAEEVSPPQRAESEERSAPAPAEVAAPVEETAHSEEVALAQSAPEAETPVVETHAEEQPKIEEAVVVAAVSEAVKETVEVEPETAEEDEEPLDPSAPLWTRKDFAHAMKGDVRGSLPEAITGISIDTRSLEAGDAFFALKGPNFDGHQFVSAALEAGAAVAVVERAQLSDLPEDGRYVVVEDVLEALQDLGIAARARTRARIIAVTGSVGKTSTKEALKLALSRSGRAHASAASYNNHWGVPLTLARMHAATEFGVFEIGMNHAGEITPLVKMVRPHVVMITTVEAVHLEFFESVEGIARAKAEIFDGLEPGGTAILNRDNRQYDLLRYLASIAGVKNIVTFGQRKGAQAVAEKVVPRADCTTLTANILGNSITYKVGSPGAHHINNSLGVLAGVACLGADLALAGLALGEMRPPKGRGEQTVLNVGGKFAYLIDESYNANPASMKAALDLLGGLPIEGRGRRIAVVGDMLELGPDSEKFHAQIAGEVERAGVDLVYCVGSEMKSLWDTLPTDKRVAYSKDSRGMVDRVLSDISPCDIIMIKGSLGTRMGLIVDAVKSRYAEPAEG